MDRQRVAKSLIIFDSDMALLLRRCLSDEHNPGNFDLPGGEVEFKEGLRVGAAREIREETGLPIYPKQLNLAWEGESVKQRREGMRLVMRRLFVVKLPPDEPLDVVLNRQEHDYFELLPLSEIADRLNHPDWSRGIRFVIASTQKTTSLPNEVA